MGLRNYITTLFVAFAAVAAAAQTQVVAHRGYWRAPGSAQNSIASLCKADSINCYGSEFDVWLSTDGVLFVNHDAVFKGTTLSKARRLN